MSFHDHGVLSCSDLISVVTNHPGILILLNNLSYLIFREDYYLLPKMRSYLNIFSVFLISSPFALLVMSIVRCLYIGAYYPIFHRTSVTRRRLLTLLAILLIPMTVLYIISKNGLVISILVNLPTLMAFFLPPFIFVNFKLIAIVRKERSKREISCTRKNLKNISIALWVVVCLMLLYIPTSFYIAFNLGEKATNTRIFSWISAPTCRTMNCASNSLIIFCKNTVLRTERIKTLKRLKYRLLGS